MSIEYDNFLKFIKELKIILKYRKDNEEQFIIEGRERLKLNYKKNYKNDDKNNDDIDVDLLNPHPYN